MNKKLIEGVKEVVRTAMMAVIPLVIVDLQTQSFNWKAWAIAGVIALLSGVDKWLHKNQHGSRYSY